MTIEFTIPLAIRASLSIVLDSAPVTREHIDTAIDSFNHKWENHALVASGPATVYADCLGPLNNDWRGESYDKVTGERGTFDLRTEAEKAEHLDAVQDLMRELLSFPDHLESEDPSDLDRFSTFYAEWRRRAQRVLDARH